ncbi:MJ0042-type zinc finger domain-containing protein [Brucella anthropi]|uniref:MJ0042-type zinc finger domain-containing protein n=1 Tax=Brucella anthropi TaxID=529 RepID=UPI00358EEBB6
MNGVQTCPNCKSLYTITEQSMGVPGGQDREPIYCPHCRHLVREEMTDGFWRTEKVSEDQ